MRRTLESVFWLIAVGFTVHVHAQPPQKTPVNVAEDVTWTREVTVDRAVRVQKGTLTIAPGTKVTFAPGGVISVTEEGALVAGGTERTPIEFVGTTTGLIRGTPGRIVIERCVITGVGEKDWLNAVAGKEGIAVRNCQITDCGRAFVRLGRWNRCEVSGCRLRACRGGIGIQGTGWAVVDRNAVEGADVSVGGALTTLMNNVVIRGTIVGDRTDRFLVERNYVHQPRTEGTYCIRQAEGVIRNNVFRGGSWVSARIGGKITGNVFLSVPHEEVLREKKSFDRNCTHAHVCFLPAGSRLSRNIFVGAAYGGVVGVGSRTLSDCVFRNNTFDMRGYGNVFWLNHLARLHPKNITIRSNLFMRSDGLWDSKGKTGLTDSVGYADYNLWAGPEKAGRLRRKGRFHNVTMTVKSPGDPGFGGSDVPPYAERDRTLSPEAVVLNPNVTFPFSDEDMLSGRHTVAEVLAHYRKAYSPKRGSPGIDAGDPADKDDPEVKDGKPDIGAVEYTGE